MKRIIIPAIASLVLACSPQLDRSIRPTAGPAPTINLGQTESFSLENGLKVFVVEDHKLPKVSFSLQFDVDPILEKNMSGMGEITGQLLGTGTANRSKDEINESIDFIGASLNTGSGYVGGRSLKKYQNELLEILSDVVINPSFTQEELDKVKTQVKSSLAQSQDDASSIAGNIKSVVNFGTDHPYGEVTTEATVEAIPLEACKQYFKAFYRPNVAYLSIVGDITLDEAKALADKYFGNWEKAEVPSMKYNTPTAPEKTNIALANRNGAVQSIINITWPVDLKPGSSDAIKASVMNAILGGGSTARLFMNLREGHGYTYGAYSSLGTDDLIASFSASASVRNGVTDSSIVEFFNEINKIRTEEVSQDELAGVISSMTGQFAMALENAATKARFAVNVDKYNLPSDYYTTYLQKLSAVTTTDVLAMAKKYLKPENANIVVVGAVDELEDKLARFGEITKYDAFGNIAIELAPAPKGVTAATVIDAYVKAIGGSKAIKRVKDVKQEMKVSIAGVPMELSAEILQKAPSKYSFVMMMGGNPMQTQIFDGKRGIMKSMAGNKELEGEELERMKATSLLFPELDFEALGYTTTLLGIDGSDYKVEVVDPSGSKSYDYFNVETGLRTKSESAEGGQEYSDYREVKGVKFPYITEMAAGPQKVKMEITNIKVNGGISNSKFSVE